MSEDKRNQSGVVCQRGALKLVVIILYCRVKREAHLSGYLCVWNGSESRLSTVLLKIYPTRKAPFRTLPL